ncbi:MAG TPA: hypothetical protein VK912_07225 [Longimicrobiales bacterium]|nr:hypothetical protein [Longimicrobiales bacterium]
MTPTTHPGRCSFACAVATFFTLAAGLVCAQTIHAQSDPVHTRVVLGAGASWAGGGVETSAGMGLAGHVGMRHQRGAYSVSLRAGMNGGGGSRFRAPGGNLHDRFDELALLVGRDFYRTEVAQVTLSAGLAAVDGERVISEAGGGARNVGFGTKIGFPLQVAVSAPGPKSGFGLTVHVNLNAEEVFGAVTATYLIGLDR